MTALAQRHRIARQLHELEERRRREHMAQTERMSVDEYRAALASGGRGAKFGERRTEHLSPTYGLIHGVRSRLQARLYAWLDGRMAHGELAWWRWEVSIPLGAASKSGRHHRIVVDAIAQPHDGPLEVWDAKAGATITRAWINKADNLRRETGVEIGLWPRDGRQETGHETRDAIT